MLLYHWDSGRQAVASKAVAGFVVAACEGTSEREDEVYTGLRTGCFALTNHQAVAYVSSGASLGDRLPDVQ